MAPEQARGEPVDARSDLFALGCVLYRAATGELPFPGTGAMQVLRALELEEPPPPGEIEPSLPAAFTELLSRLLAKDRAARPPAAAAVARALEDIANEPPRTQPSGRSPRWRWLPFSAALLAPLGLAAALLLPHLPRQPADQRPPAGGTVDAGSPLPPSDTEVEEVGQVRVLRGHNNGVGPVRFGPDGRRALSGSWGDPTRLWDLDTGNELRRLEGYVGWVGAVAFDAAGRRALCIGTRDRAGEVRLWDLDTGHEPLREGGLPGLTGLAVGFAGDVPLALTAEPNGDLHLWDVARKQERCRLAGHRDSIERACLSPDGRRVLSGGKDGTARLWDAASGSLLQTFTGHRGNVLAVALVPDGRVFTGGSDGTVRLWDANTGKSLLVLEGHQGEVKSVAVSLDGRRALSGGQDRTVRLLGPDDRPSAALL
jgi:hypothetical protein